MAEAQASKEILERQLQEARSHVAGLQAELQAGALPPQHSCLPPRFFSLLSRFLIVEA